MSEDMPWVNGLTDEEVQELRNKKQELTQYGKEKIRELMNDGKLRFYDKGKETFAVEDPYWGGQSPETQLHIKKMTHEEMLEEAAKREAIVAKVSDEDYQKVLDAAKEEKVLDIAKNIMEENKEAFQHLAAIERKEFAEKDFEDLTREQKIQLALEEIDWIVIGGQDGEEFYGSIQFLRKVLRSLV
jgi:hypothetical protein